MKAILIFLGLAVATLAAPSNKDTRDTSPPCNTGYYLSVENAEYQLSQTGLYVIASTSCDVGSTAYVTAGVASEFTNYLYWYSTMSLWLSGPNDPSQCSSTVGAYGSGGDKSSPLTVTAWNEWDGSGWVTGTTFTVVCIVPPCDAQLSISSSTCENGLAGLYDLAPEGAWCSARPSFQSSSTALTFNMTYQVWVFGPDPCNTLANIAAYPTLVNYPYDYPSSWADPCSGSFVPNSAYVVNPICPARDSQHPARHHNHIYNNINPGDKAVVPADVVASMPTNRILTGPLTGQLPMAAPPAEKMIDPHQPWQFEP